MGGLVVGAPRTIMGGLPLNNILQDFRHLRAASNDLTLQSFLTTLSQSAQAVPIPTAPYRPSVNSRSHNHVVPSWDLFRLQHQSTCPFLFFSFSIFPQPLTATNSDTAAPSCITDVFGNHRPRYRCPFFHGSFRTFSGPFSITTTPSPAPFPLPPPPRPPPLPPNLLWTPST